jgi:hypothetical protein
MKYTVVYVATVSEDGEFTPEWRVSSKRFNTPEEAQEYADGVAQSRRAFVAEIDA